jgi:hypothetical protein
LPSSGIRAHSLLLLTHQVSAHIHCCYSRIMYRGTFTVATHASCIGAHSLFLLTLHVSGHIHCFHSRVMHVSGHIHCFYSRIRYPRTFTVATHASCIRAHSLLLLTHQVSAHIRCCYIHCCYSHIGQHKVTYCRHWSLW